MENQFCPRCYTLLSAITDIDSKVKFQCPSCTHNVELVDSVLMKRVNQTTQPKKKLNRSMTHDNSLMRTKAVTCPNTTCSGNNPELWGTYENGKLVQPDVALTNFFSEDRVTTYICLVCGQTFLPAGAAAKELAAAS